MDNIADMEVKQPFTHADDDFASVSWSQLSKKQMEFSCTGIQYVLCDAESNFLVLRFTSFPLRPKINSQCLSICQASVNML